MQRHPFDPLSAALGILAMGLGVLVAAARIDELDGNSGAWIAAGVLVVGLGLIPWSRHRSRDAAFPVHTGDDDVDPGHDHPGPR